VALPVRRCAGALDDPDVRRQLAGEGIRIPERTVAVAALHSTTTDTVTLDGAGTPGEVGAVLQRLGDDLARAGRAAGRVSCRALPGAPDGDARTAATHVRTRAPDWAEPAPEMGPACNEAFVAGPRWLTESLDLRGRVFQHSYEAPSDQQRAILGAILNARVGVAHWINSQYYFATVDPQRFGAGDKSTHNGLGEVGVITGASGDLGIGLPWQALAGRESQVGTAEALHEPLRLTVVLCAATEAIDAVLADGPAVAQLAANGWMTIIPLDPVRVVLARGAHDVTAAG
jgi:hypothetical protein